MSKIYFNGFSLGYNEIYGIHRNTIELLNELDKFVDKNKIQVIVKKNSVRHFDFKNIDIVELDFNKVWQNNNFFVFLWKMFGFNKYAKKEKGISVDLILSLPLFGSDVVMIYDCIRELFPENTVNLRQKLSRLFYILRVKINLKKAKVVLTDSESAREDISKMYNYPKDRIVVIPCAWQHFNKVKEDNSILNKLKIEKKKYFFSLGSRAFHKNFKWVYEAAKQNEAYTFVVSGTDALSKSDKFLENDKPNNLLFTGYLKDEEIKSLMKNCIAFIQPSIYEGFGIPPMEAMSTGVDCIVSNTSSLPEVYKNSVWYIDPKKYDSINMEEIMKVPKEPNDIILNEYSWVKSAEILYSILKMYM